MAEPSPTKAFEMPPLSQCKDRPQPPPSSCYDHTDSIKLKVIDGENQQTFVIARGLLRWYSAFFAADLDPNGSFKQSSSEERELQEELPVVRAFNCWLYTGRLMDPLESKDSSDADKYLDWALLCKIWVFADFRGIPSLKNAAIDMLHEQLAATWLTPGHLIRYVYRQSPEGSQLRKFFIDVYCTTKGLDDFLQLRRFAIPKDFLWDVIPNLAERGKDSQSCGQTTWAKLDRCVWHDHSGPGGKLRNERSS